MWRIANLTLMEEISEKWEEAETAKDFLLTNKKKSDVDRAAGEEIHAKACEQLGETNKRKGETGESRPKKTRRSSSETLDFLKEKLAVRQTESQQQAKAHEELMATQREQQKLQTTMLTMMQSQNQAILQLLSKMSDK